MGLKTCPIVLAVFDEEWKETPRAQPEESKISNGDQYLEEIAGPHYEDHRTWDREIHTLI